MSALSPPADPTPTGARPRADPAAAAVSERFDRDRDRPLRFALMATSFLALLAATTIVVVRRNGGAFSYAIDDPAIHLTIARNLARHGTFGIVPGVYESASSAPLWNIALAPILWVDADAWWSPLVLNSAAAIWLIWSLSGLPALRALRPRRLASAVCIALPLGLGLVPLVLTGMEHTLHAALTAQFLIQFARLGSGRGRRIDLAVCGVLLAVGTLVRFETIFIAMGAAAALLLDARRPDAQGPRGTIGRPGIVALVIVGAAAVPALGFAAANMAFGQYPLPNSVMAKTAAGRGIPWPDPATVLERVTHDPLLLAVLVTAVVALVAARRPARTTDSRRTASRPLLAVLIAAVLHLGFAEVGWFERYQAYLVIAAVVGLALLSPALDIGRRTQVRLGIGVLVLCILRVPLLANTPLATFNVHQNQVQLGRFLAAEYDGQTVAVNDLGYVSWLHQGGVLDVAGLGSYEVLRAQKEQRLDAAAFAGLLDDHEVAIIAVYDEFFGPLIPPSWTEAGRWCVTNRRMVLSSDCVAFYTRPGADLDDARAALARFEAQLPPETVTVVTSP